MELKRYVLLVNKEIVETQEKHFIDNYNRLCLKMNDGCYVSYSVEKTSDNIIDLVEVSDLIATLYDSTIFEVGAIEDGIFYQKKHELKAYFNDVKAIYKRQPNGDYKKYEVK